MSCSNCYNGCPQITSDQCVKYTGVDVPLLGIKNGDSLSYVEQSLITFLVATMDAANIKVEIDKSIICETVQAHLDKCKDLTVADLLKALVKVVCELKIAVTGNTNDISDIQTFIEDLESNYNLSTCITGVTASSGTHDILQAVIDKLCAFIIDVEATYVKLEDLDDLIAAYLASLTPGTVQYNTRMVPYSIVAYRGPLTNFTSDGKGLLANGYDKIYLCNGENNTPDLRGRTIVGTTSMGSASYDPAVNPFTPGNPTYTIDTKVGQNTVTLSEPQMPSHTHTPSIVLNDPGHTHDILGIRGGDDDNHDNTIRFAGGDKPNDQTGFHFTNTTACQSKQTGITVGSQTNSLTGGNESHINIQPSYALHYIIYIP